MVRVKEHPLDSHRNHRAHACIEVLEPQREQEGTIVVTTESAAEPSSSPIVL